MKKALEFLSDTWFVILMVLSFVAMLIILAIY